MLTRRLATFCLGMWLGCCFLVNILVLQSGESAARVLAEVSQGVLDVTHGVGQDKTLLLLHHHGEEITRTLLNGWGGAQLVLGLVILVLTAFMDSRKGLAMLLGGLMLVVTAVQYWAIVPEWNFVGRELDFVSENAQFNLHTQAWTMARAYAATEALKIILGGALASYFFAAESVIRRRSSSRSHSAVAAVPE